MPINRGGFAWTPNQQEIDRYRSMREAGCSRAEIAEAFGKSPNLLDEMRRAKLFGEIPTMQGRGGGARKHAPEKSDNEHRIMGLPIAEVRQRQSAIRDAWSDEERYWRQRGELPGRPRRLPTSDERLGRAGERQLSARPLRPGAHPHRSH